MERSKDKDVRDLADEFFADLFMGIVKAKNPEFQASLELRIDKLLLADKNRPKEGART